MKVDESKKLKKGTRVCWRGHAADSGIVTETSWDASQSLGTMDRWPACTMETCARFSGCRQGRLP